MKKVFFYGTVILLSIALSSLSLFYGLYNTRLADAQESFSVFDFQDADKNFGDAEKYLNYGSNIPWLLSSEMTNMKNYRSQVRYWLGYYEDLISDFQFQQDSNNNSSPEEDFIKGNAFYRIMETEKNKTRVIGLLDSAILKYADSINADSDNCNAAFNYEYLLRVRNDVSGGKKKLPLKQQAAVQLQEKIRGDQTGQNSNIHGQEGNQVIAKDTEKMPIHVPISGSELKEKGGEEAGKGVIQRRKG